MNMIQRIINWYIKLWADAIAKMREGKGSFKMPINEARWYLLFAAGTLRTIAISTISTILTGYPQPIPLCCNSKSMFMFGLVLFFFLPIVLFDYYLIFHKDRYKKISPTNPKSWIFWLLYIIIIPACIYLSIMLYIVAMGKEWIQHNILF